MNRKEAAIAIVNEFISNFNETTAVSFDNQNTFRYCTSPLTNTTKPSNSPWVIFNVEGNKTIKATLGTEGHRRFRRAGFIASSVLVPEGGGTSDGLDLCEEIISIFEGKRIASDIVFTYGDYFPIRNTNDGWYQFNITVYFTFDESK